MGAISRPLFKRGQVYCLVRLSVWARREWTLRKAFLLDKAALALRTAASDGEQYRGDAKFGKKIFLRTRQVLTAIDDQRAR